MPQLPLPPGGAPLDGGDLTVSDSSDVASELPNNIATIAIAPVRDAFLEAWTAGFVKYQKIASYAAAQSDPMRATGDYLLDFADEHGVIPAIDDTEEDIRAQLFATPEIVTPQAILDGVNGILANYTTKTAYYHEYELDGMFVQATSVGSPWCSFAGAAPNYPDRYYDADPAYAPVGCVPWNGRPRSFVLRIPVLGLNADQYAYVNTVATSSGPFAGSGFYVFKSNDIASDVYASIVRLVDRIKGQGMTWTMIADPSI